ncbi:hypothetical protein GCM10010274_29200 [Streptomyces lavendofoliae]|uniref:Uncharacterized protein n=1 Tax=Streptomyces lavendofoliae TaxID=67314 RepID=A0A918M4L8_9ACTN|nr:hypothetical protein GCM10010274_29200 [Streptomyces lavendofoliae]
MAAAEPVIWRTSRFCTVSCIHVPALDTRFATDHQRMPRYRRERQGEWSARVRVGGGEEEGTVNGGGDEPVDSDGGIRRK